MGYYHKTRDFKADDDSVESVQEYVMETCTLFGASNKVAYQLSLITEEIFVNVAHYAYGDEKGICSVDVNFDTDKKYLELVFMDSGKPFNPIEKEDPDITLSADQRKIGGLGIFIVKQISDNISYKYENDKNILQIGKFI